MCAELYVCVFFFQAEDGIRDLVRSRGLGDVYKRQGEARLAAEDLVGQAAAGQVPGVVSAGVARAAVDPVSYTHLTLPTSDLV